MKISTMKSLDRYLGVFLCWIVGLFVCKSTSTMPRPVHNILVIKFFGMGSIILTTPALALLKKKFPAAKITFLSFYSNRELLTRYTILDDVLTLSTVSLRTFIKDTYLLLLHFRKTQYDIVFDFEFFSKYSTLLSTLTGSPVRIGFALPTLWRKMHLTHQVELSKERHVTQAFCEQIFSIAGQEEIPSVFPPISTEEDDSSITRTLELNGKFSIVINVNAGETFLERRWHADRFVELIDILAEDPNAILLFTGVREEHNHVQQILDRGHTTTQCRNLAGMLTFPELIALLKNSGLVISNDSGPLHLAAALGTPVIGLYGPESPTFYGPVGANVKTLYKAIACSPCMNIYAAKTFRCPYQARCMNEIHVNEVLTAVEQLLIAQ